MAERNISAYTRPRYIESAFSQTVYVGVLKTPTLSLNGTSTTTTGLLSWGNIDDNTSYFELWVSYNGGAWELYDDNIFYPQASYQLNGALADGTYKFKIRATAVITDPDTSVTASYYSAFSNETFEFTVVTLAAPVLEDITGTSQYYWASITDAEYYSFIITKNNSTNTVVTILEADRPTSVDPYILDYSDPGIYTLVAIAYNNNPFLYHNSAESNSKTYTVIKLATPVLDESQFTADPPVIYWSSIQYASGYDIYLNNVLVMTNHSSLNYNFTNDLPDFPGVYDFAGKIKAIVANQVQYANPKYLDSEFSNIITWGLLPTPIISMNTAEGYDNRVMITNYEDLYNAHYLEIYDNGVLYDTIIVGEYYELISSVPRAFNIRIKAVSDDPNMTDSSLSNQVSYQIIKLGSPVLTDVSQPDSDVMSLSWTSVTNAQYYDVYLNGEVISSTSSLTINISLPVGTNSVFVVAKSRYYRYLDGNPSNIITKTKQPSSQYTVQISDIVYDISLPFVFNVTMDETMDTASLSTVPINDDKPFEAYTEVQINAAIEKTTETGQTSYSQLKDFPKYMIIAQDEVEEVNIGESSKYIHHLNLIERTKLLETELMPDFSITQPLEYAQKVNEIILNGSVTPDYGGYNIWTDADYNKLVKYCDTIVFTLVYNLYRAESWYFTGLVNQSLVGEMFPGISKGDQVPLPYETATKIRCYDSYKWLQQIAGIPGPKHGYVESYLAGTIKKTYKYRTHSDSYEVDENHPETVIAEYTDGVQHIWDTSNVPVGRYDLILEVSLEDWSSLLNSFPGFGDVDTLSRQPEFMYSGTIPWWGTLGYPSSPNAHPDHIHYSEETGYLGFNTPMTAGSHKNPNDIPFWSQQKRYRVVWKGITISNVPSYATDDVIPFESKSIKDAIDKALTLVKPIGVDRNKTPKYTLDPKFDYLGNYKEEADANNKKTKVNYYPCPELKFQNQKSLYEVLTEIGRLFYGIPRLGCYDRYGIYQPNMITFDVLDKSTIEAANQAQFTDQNTLETTTATIDNHNTGFVSNLSNVVNNEFYMTYPAGNLWTTPRSGSDTDPLANKDNMSIVIDRPIYRIVDVLVRNFDADDPSRYVSIKPFVNELSIFNSLNNDADGKGLSIYYSQGDNKIEGLGQIPQNTQIQAALGLNQDDYIISVIIEFASGDVSREAVNGRANNLEYKVIYVPYIDTQLYTEQSNVSGLRNQNYKALNQENNIITDISFGQSAQTQVERLGNNNIEKAYYNTEYNMMPKLGQIKEFDGYKYYADNITYTFNNAGFVGSVSFSKNYNKINERVGIDAMYRLYRIYADDFVDRCININRYCYISKSSYTDVSASTMQNTNYQLLKDIKNALNNGSDISVPNIKPDSIYIRNMNDDGTRLQYNAYDDGTLINVPALMLPVAYNRYGTSISFTGEMKDNFSAGITTAKYNSATGSYITDSYNGQRIQHDARYCDTNGELDVMGITIFRYDDDSRLGVSSDMYPIAKYITSNINILNEAIYSEKIKILKDNRERIKFNYQLHFQTFDKYLTIHNGITSRLFVNDNRFASSSSSSWGSPRYVLFKGDISKQQKIGNTPVQTCSIPSVATGGLYIIIGIVNATADSDYDGYALIWPNGEILYSYRTPIAAGSYSIPPMYLNFSDNKIDFKNS